MSQGFEEGGKGNGRGDGGERRELGEGRKCRARKGEINKMATAQISL
jgi:hypothetical protein